MRKICTIAESYSGSLNVPTCCKNLVRVLAKTKKDFKIGECLSKRLSKRLSKHFALSAVHIFRTGAESR